jgi:copper(I)-binding protein
MLRSLTLAIAIAAGGHVLAQAPTIGTPVGGITAVEPWSRATPGGAPVGAGYLVIENNGPAPDRFVGAETELSDKVELHETRVAEGVARMLPVESIVVPPGGRIELKPGGYHLMLTGLKRPLKEGERFSGTLVFEKAGRVPVSFAVRGLGAGAHHHH